MPQKKNQDKIIITAHHHVLRNTTTISNAGGGAGIHANNTGDFEGAELILNSLLQKFQVNQQFVCECRFR
jgi:hypothetical protein